MSKLKGKLTNMFDKYLGNWFDTLQPRERVAISFLFFFTILIIAIYGTWKPTQTWLLYTEEYYLEQRAEWNWMKNHEEQASNLVQNNVTNDVKDQSLIGAATSLAKTYEITLKRFEPKGDVSVRIWLDNVPFNRLALWLNELGMQHNAYVSQITMKRQPTAGHVSATLTLKQ